MYYDSDEYARFFRTLLLAEKKIKEGVNEISRLREGMELEYTQIFPKSEQNQLYYDAGLLIKNEDK